ncbi:hypothetical protein MXB_3366 [Myxobolus squamalis]|nr:hypothetical protein MXB_3366 [Myxobolus squamalis]
MKTLFSQLDKFRCLLKPSSDVYHSSLYIRNGFIKAVETDLLMKMSNVTLATHFASKLENPVFCCNVSTCKFLNSNSQCSRGECCERCKFNKNKVCRKSIGECDLEERCSGTHHEGFCYNGMCTDHDSLCKYVFKNDDVYFSQDCVTKTIELIQKNCSGYQEDFKKNVVQIHVNISFALTLALPFII